MKRGLFIAVVLTLSAFVAERANAQTASAHGSGTENTFFAVCSTCVPPILSSGGKGLRFDFSFRGTGTGMVPSIGTLTAVDKETNISLAYQGLATINTDFHTLSGSGACLLTAPDGTTVSGTCTFSARDTTSG